MVNRVATTYDAMHSMTSRIKGLSGMAENVRRGFRAGGRAPWGYRLEHVQTGAVRDGLPVTKSRLVLSDEADVAAAYLKARAAGRSRSALCMQLGIRLSHTSLVGVEWNALTYAGHTVWNVHNAYDRGGYRGGIKRRPREQWVIQRGTHAALITDDEADTILRRLEASPFKKKRRTGATYLLTGILQAPDGAAWYGDKGGRYYRIAKKGAGASRSLDAAAVDKLVLGLVTTDLRSPRFVSNTLQHTKRILGRDHSAKLAELRQEYAALGRRIDRFMDMAAELETRGPVLRKVNAIERERAELERKIADLEESSRTAATISSITESDVARLLTGMADEMDRYDRESLKDGLAAVLERVELDPTTLEMRLDYRIGLPVRNKLASPRESAVIPLTNSTTSKVA
jgi:site-specific DNA recombinase